MRKYVPKGSKDAETYPAHGDVKHGGKPFWTGNPACLKNDAEDGNSPDYSKERVT